MISILQTKTKHSNHGSKSNRTLDSLSRNKTKFDMSADENYFINRLRLEKNRAQRSGSALSILLLKLNKPIDNNAANIREILRVVESKIRETDIAGYVDPTTIGVLLPYTDEKGAKRSAEKLIKSFINPQFSISASIYPDEIFESLTQNGFVSPEVSEHMLEDSPRHPLLKLHIKRVIDVIGSLIGLITLSPIMLFAAILVKTGSPGPVIFKQIRLGHKGKPFEFYKFRSMYTDSNDQIHRDYVSKLIGGNDTAINNGDAETPLYKISSDPRVTPIGEFIRKTSIDELPQLYNVLIGDMSLVGPRPPLPYEAEEYQPWHLKRILEMKPGITGLWQVEGRSSVQFDDAVRMDVRYIQTWTLMLDIKILVKTVKEVLACRGAV